MLGVATLKALLEDDLVLARAIKSRDYRTPYATVVVARRGLKETMAITDPGLYLTLSMLRSSFESVTRSKSRFEDHDHDSRQERCLPASSSKED